MFIFIKNALFCFYLQTSCGATKELTNVISSRTEPDTFVFTAKTLLQKACTAASMIWVVSMFATHVSTLRKSKTQRAIFYN